MTSAGSFENFNRKEKTKISSNRSFGLVFSGVFFTLAFFAWKKGSGYLTTWIVFGVVMLIMALALPTYLAPLNKSWNRLGLLLHYIVTPIVMFLMFFVVFMPLGFVLRLFGKLSLKKKFDPQIQTYWITRSEPGPKPESMKLSF